MSNPVPAHYQDARGVQHEVIVRKAPDGAWQVVDVSVRETKLIENLTGISDGRPEAEAIALEYTREQQAASEETATPTRCL
jgi:hypothetical protein